MNASSPQQLPTRDLRKPAALIINPAAGRKLGLETNPYGREQVEAALRAEEIPFELWATQGPGHATVLARQAAAEHRELVIAAGGDGTLHEVARGVLNTDTSLGVMPLGSVMNLARTLGVPRDPAGAARTIRAGRTVAMDVGNMNGQLFLEGAGVGIMAGLFGYFQQLDRTGPRLGVVRAALRYVRLPSTPNLFLELDDGERLDPTTLALNVSNTPYIGAALAIAPDARIDDGLLDIAVLDRTNLRRLIVYLALSANGRPVPPPPHTQIRQTRRLRVSVGRADHPLPVHADGVPTGITPVTFEVSPAAMRVIVGSASRTGKSPWADPGTVGS